MHIFYLTYFDKNLNLISKFKIKVLQTYVINLEVSFENKKKTKLKPSC